MNQRRKQIATVITIALATAMSPSARVWAADTSDVQDLQQEVRQLRADLQVLQGAFGEMTELEREGAANLARALPEPSTPVQPASRPPAAPSVAAVEPPRPLAPAMARDDQGRGASRQHRPKKRVARSRAKSTRQKAGDRDR